jgi:hypothetical protein
MLDLISDGPYEEINFNPLDKMIKAENTTLCTVKLKFNIELEEKWMVTNPKVPRIYVTPKTHKQGKKLRPSITCIIDVPSEIVAKRLAYQFKQFPGPSGFYENTCYIVPECTN